MCQPVVLVVAYDNTKRHLSYKNDLLNREKDNRTFLMESLSTHLTYPWFKSGMYPYVGIESRTPVETLATCRTSVRLFLCMNDLVPA